MKHVSCTTKSSKSINVHNNFSSSHSFASLFSSSADHHAVSRVRSPSLYISQFNSMPLLLNLLFSSGELNRRQIHISRTSRPANQQLIPLGPIPARMRIDIVRNIIAILVLHTSRVGRNIEQMGRRRPRPGRLARSAPADADAAVALLHEGDVGLVVLWEGRVLLALSVGKRGKAKSEAGDLLRSSRKMQNRCRTGRRRLPRSCRSWLGLACCRCHWRRCRSGTKIFLSVSRHLRQGGKFRLTAERSPY